MVLLDLINVEKFGTELSLHCGCDILCGIVRWQQNMFKNIFCRYGKTA